MALNASILGPALKSAVQGVPFNPNASAYSDAIYLAMANAIIAHIVANAVVAVTVTSVSGVTTGPGVSGPGVGTGTIS